MMSLGWGAVLVPSLKQKLNLNISIERELAGSQYVLSVLLCSKHLIEAQGYTVEQKRFYQDNKSTTLMENNGRASIYKRNISRSDFFIKHNVDKGNEEVE